MLWDSYTTPQALLRHELDQRAESGHDVREVAALVGDPDALDDATARALLDALAVCPPVPDWSYVEPSELEAIVAEFPPDPISTDPTSTDPTSTDPESTAPDPSVADPPDLDDRIAGAWLGRCAGNCLGKPVENGDVWTPDVLRDYLTATGNYPIHTYIARSDPMPAGLRLVGSPHETTAGNIHFVPRDDDLDYTLLGLYLLERHGRDLTTADVADAWTTLFPYATTYTAERATYRNLVAGVAPEAAARRDNPYREWIGAQIRADAFGYAFPGRPLEAARLAWQDARLSHVANGIYGEMWAAAFVASCFTATSIEAAFDRALCYVPERSRLSEALRWVRERVVDGAEWEGLVREIHARWAGMHWVHTVNNAAIIAAAVLTCGGDYTTAVGRTVAGGLDTDSNGATTGSLLGALVGRAGVPASWTDDFDDRIRSALFGFDNSSLADVIARTARVARAFAAEAPA